MGQDAIQRHFLAVHPTVDLPEDFSDIDTERAAVLLANVLPVMAS